MDQVKKLFSQPDTSSYLGLRDRVMMELLYSSGLRVSELVGLNRQDLDIENQEVRLRGKGKKERMVPITDGCALWLKTYLEHPERYLDIDGHAKQQDESAIFETVMGQGFLAVQSTVILTNTSLLPGWLAK